LSKSVNLGVSSNINQGFASQLTSQTNSKIPANMMPNPGINFNYNLRMQMPFSMQRANMNNLSNVMINPMTGRNMVVSNSTGLNNNLHSATQTKPVVTNTNLSQNKISGPKMPITIYPTYYNNSKFYLFLVMMRNIQNIQNFQNYQNLQSFQNLQNFQNSANQVPPTTQKNNMKDSEDLTDSKSCYESTQSGPNINNLQETVSKVQFPSMTPCFYQGNPYFYPQFPYTTLQKKDISGFNTISGFTNTDLKLKKDL
jgi:hypothetical protein